MSLLRRCGQRGPQYKSYAEPGYIEGDVARCVICGRRFVVTAAERSPDGAFVVPEHRYPSKAEMRAWRRAGLIRS